MRSTRQPKSNWLPTFKGSFYCTLDKKGRFRLPDSFVEELRRCVSVPRQMVIALGNDEIRIYSCKLYDTLPKGPLANEEKVRFIKENRFSKRILHDWLNRVQIPDEIRRELGLYGRIRLNLVGFVDYFTVTPVD